MKRMQRWIYILLLVLTVPVWGDNVARKQAEMLNAEVNTLIEQLNTTCDTATYYATLQEVMDKAVRCDQYDATPDDKGRVKIRYRHHNAKQLAPLRPQLIDAGMYYHSKRRNPEAVKCFQTYIAGAESGLFKVKKDLYKGQAAYFAALISFGLHDYESTNHYCDIALKDADYARDAAEIKINCMKETRETSVDSARYVVALLELHEYDPHNQSYFKMLLGEFTEGGREDELARLVADEVIKDPENQIAWAILGDLKMKKEDWNGAITAYRNAMALDDVPVEIRHNLGVCYSAQAQTKAKDKDITLDAETKGLLEEAARQFEMVRQEDPECKRADWVKPLYQVYLILGEKEKAKALESRIGE